MKRLKRGDVCFMNSDEWSCKINDTFSRLDKKDSVRMIPSGSVAIVIGVADNFADVVVAGYDGRWYIRGISLTEIDIYDK